jgi:rhodanese-related sulfurtransferase
MVGRIDAGTVKAWLAEGREFAFLDVRERGQYGERHPFFAVSRPYSRFEPALPDLLPNPSVRLVLCDEGDGVAEQAARRAEAAGFANVFVLDGGVAAWQQAGYTLYAGVNVPSKAFGELVEHVRGTPHVSPAELQAMRQSGEDMVILDGRPFAEYRVMNIPGGICCPNAELALHVGVIAPNPRTKVIVNCAGRTRSIIGAQTLIDLGIPNPVFALENGTQGWFLAGLELEHGATRRALVHASPDAIATVRDRARVLAAAHGAAFVSAAEVVAWLAEPRTTYLFDVRSPEEFAASPVPGFRHAPGGQLVQATDQWIAVRGARIVLLDAEAVRAPITASWLRQQGHQAYVLDGGTHAAAGIAFRSGIKMPAIPELSEIEAGELAQALAEQRAHAIDLRPSMAYRKGHLAGAVWSIRPRIASAATDPSQLVVLIADEPEVAALVALDLRAAGFGVIRRSNGDEASLRAAGLAIITTPGDPPDGTCIDFLFFTHARHAGDAAAARRYLAWEIGLVRQLDAVERGAFRIAASS